jgi:hypothetical protein
MLATASQVSIEQSAPKGLRAAGRGFRDFMKWLSSIEKKKIGPHAD